MNPSIAAIHRCTKYLVGRTEKRVRTRVDREESMKYSLNGINKTISEILQENNSSSLTEQEIWDQYFLRDERLKFIIEKREIKTLQELLLRTQDYYAENKLWY